MKLRSYITSKRLARHVAAVALLSWPLFTAVAGFAEERKFIIFLANMPRSFVETGGTPPTSLPGAADVEYFYFSDSNPTGFFTGNEDSDEFGSFAEYWEEISCGIVHVVGKVMSTPELPWPQYPVIDDIQTTRGDVDTIEADFSPSTDSNGTGYFDLNNSPDFQFGEGEELREFLVYYETDFTNTAIADELNPQPAIPDNHPSVSGAGTEDLDGDGRIDLGVEDLDLDTRHDLVSEDRNGNCILDFVSEDCLCGDCDGVWDEDSEDCNGNGQEDHLFEDIDGDGHLDAGEACLPCLPDDNCLVGGDGNMHADVNCDGELSDNEDLDGDGNFDDSNEDTNANCTCAGHGTPDCDPDEIPGFNPPFYSGVFTPGERFRDMDGDEYYDALFEPATIVNLNNDENINCYSYTNANLEARGDVDDFNDTNGDGNRNFPEPLEDHLVMKVSNEPGQRWYERVETSYIRDNYPGNVSMLLARLDNNNIDKQETGRIVYDSPDYWIDMQTADGADFDDYRKLEHDSFSPTVPGHTVPRPSWLEDFWRARYGNTSAAELADLTDFGWVSETPNMIEYEPLAESTAGSDEYAFDPDVGGTSGWGTVLEQMLHLHPVYGALEMFDLEPDRDAEFPDGTLCDEQADPPVEECNGALFDYNCGAGHVYAYLDFPGFPPVDTDENSLEVELAGDDYIYGVWQDGRRGCIMPEGAEPDLENGDPPGTYGCDFDLDDDEDEVGVFGPPPTWIPAALPGSAGGMQDFDGDGQANDFMFNPCDIACHPDCDWTASPPVPLYPFPFSVEGLFPLTNPTCACVAFNVGNPETGTPDFNAFCRPGTGEWLNQDGPAPPTDPPGLCPEADDVENPEDCFVPRCTPAGNEGGSPYYPIPRLTAPADPSCDVAFKIRWGNGRLIEDPPGVWAFAVGNDDDSILPPAELVYDGPKEYDDLASSFYHTRWIAGNPLNPEEPVAVLLDYGGDQAFGEVTTSSPDVADRMTYGHDKADLGSDGGSHDPDNRITPSGPLAGGDTAYFGPNICNEGPNQGSPCIDDSDCPPDASCVADVIWGFDGSADPIHGGPGFDGGNQMILEYMTWRRDGTAPTEPMTGPPTVDGRGFRDFNLDGMLDLGEGRQFPHTLSDGTEVGGTENYVIDSFDFTRNDGREVMAYPFNRDRVVEDVVEASDFVEDFDVWINTFLGCGGTRNLADISHIVFLPPGLPSSTDFSNPSPGPDLPINTVDDMPPEAGQRVRLEDMLELYTFTNLSVSLDRGDQVDGSGNPIVNPNMMLGYVTHEFAHYWECYPDLYDYDVFDGFNIESPIGSWDLMANAGMVHVNPVLKESSGWIAPKNLTGILVPGVPHEIRLGPIETSCDQYFYYQNTNLGICADPNNPNDPPCRQERFHFFHLENHGEFSSNLPWNVLPVDPTCQPEGDAGPFRDGGMMLLHTDLAANAEGVPAQQRWGSHFSYLYEQADGQHSLEETFDAGGNTGDAGDPFPGYCNQDDWNIDTNPNNSWWELSNDSSGIEILDVHNELSGSSVTFLWFPQDVPSFQFLQPAGGQSINDQYPIIYRWDDLHAGTTLTLFAQPANPGDELEVEGLGICTAACYSGTKLNAVPITKATAGDAQETYFVPVGEGQILEDGLYRFYAFLDPNDDIPANDGLCENAATPGPNRACGQADYQGISADENVGEGRLTINFVRQNVDDPNSTRLEAWVVTHVGEQLCGGNGEWMVEGTVSGVQHVDPDDPDSPLACASTGGQFTTLNPEAAIRFTITNIGDDFALGDRFIFVTTGLTVYSAPVEVLNGQVDPGPQAIIEVSSAQDPCCFPPVAITFDGSQSTDTDGNSGPSSNILSYEWDLGNDGTVDATGPVANFTFDTAGTYAVRLTVAEGAPHYRFGSTVKTIEVVNNLPVAEFTATPNAGPAPLLVHLDASGSFDPDGEITKYEWDFDYDGPTNCCNCPIGPDVEESDPEIDHVFPEGTWYVSLRVTDDTGQTSCVAFGTVSSGNQPPVASFSATPGGGTVPLTVIFDAGGSTDPDGDELSYEWNFGDGTSGSGEFIIHEYTDVGTFEVRLTVRDDQGPASFGEASTTIVTTLGPGSVVTITQISAVPSIGPSPLTVSFSATATSQNPGPLTYRWELDPQGTLKFGRNVTHMYVNDGLEAIEVHPKLIVTDDTGAQAVRVLDITVLLEGDEGPVDDPNLEAVLSVVGDPDADQVTGMAPFMVEFSTEGSRAIDGAAVTVEVDFGDGTPPVPGLASGTISHTYRSPGEYQATATTIAGDGRRETSAPITIIVTQSSNPIATIFVDRIDGDAPLAIRFDGTGSFDPEGQPLTYEWEFGDGTPVGTGSVLNHTFNVADQYTITLTVRDTSGATGSALLGIIVGEGATSNDGTGIGPVDGGDTGDGGSQAEPGTCGLGCGPMGAVQLLLMLLGVMSMKYTLRRRR
ncbi:MAG: PKD domain-containing protein [Planctomycetes bacterium]|nr:PKD domain-containing protein [Planctomycetota bacterium]